MSFYIDRNTHERVLICQRSQFSWMRVLLSTNARELLRNLRGVLLSIKKGFCYFYLDCVRETPPLRSNEIDSGFPETRRVIMASASIRPLKRMISKDNSNPVVCTEVLVWTVSTNEEVQGMRWKPHGTPAPLIYREGQQRSWSLTARGPSGLKIGKIILLSDYLLLLELTF